MRVGQDTLEQTMPKTRSGEGEDRLPPVGSDFLYSHLLRSADHETCLPVNFDLPPRLK